MSVRRMRGCFIQRFDAMNVFDVGLDKRPPGIHIAFIKFLFRQRFVEVIPNSILYRRAEQFDQGLCVSIA